MKILDRFLDRLLLKLSGYGDLTVNMHISSEGGWEKFKKDYSPKLRHIHLGVEKMAFDVADITIMGVDITVYGPNYPNPHFDKEACLRRCARGREEQKILRLHVGEMDIEGRIKAVKEGKDIPCAE